MKNRHVPVMLKEILGFLRPRKGQMIIDCTLGGGSYTYAIAEELGKSGLVAAIDADVQAIKYNQEIINKKNIKNIILYHENFQNLSNIIETLKKEAPGKKLSGLVFDLGLSSNQLADRNRGFSFQLDAPLEMGFDSGSMKYETRSIVNSYKLHELERVIREYGEEKYAHSIVKAIARERKYNKIETTKHLVDVIAGAVPAKYRHGKIHFATRTFQALRIETNDELNALKNGLEAGIKGLESGGRVAVVSFHSLEDRIVKNFFRTESKDCLCPKELPDCQCLHKKQLSIITKKPITAGEEEIKLNPRARSAKLRVAEKV
jgi:16S rRNA (cytosine1402-N4)-methyltransferase